MKIFKTEFMKRMYMFRILSVFVIATIVIAACTKENSTVRLDPKLSTSQVLNVKSDSATVIGFVVASGDGFSERGVCYNTQADPTTDNSTVVYSDPVTKATFSVKLSGLAYATKYYARAYAINASGTIYGEEVTFTTLPVVPTLTTNPITLITGNSATGGGNVTVGGGADVTARGVCYGKNHNPTVTDTKTTNGTGTGAFVSALTGLKGNTVYYLRSYATNSAGTGYGPEVTFTTLVDLPVVTTTAVTGITKFEAVSGGEVTYDGGGTITARGLAWGLSANPTTSNSVIAGGTGTGVFVSNLTGLTLFTTYHVRAFATNSAGTAYGSDIQFTTLANIRTWNVPGDYVAASYPGSTFADWSPDKSPQVISTVSAPDNLEGYVYMANASNAWKFATQLNWDGPNYGAGTLPGTLSATGDNISSPAGYYKINVNAAALTYTSVATVWGVIGDASPNGWSDETALSYSPTLRIWKGGMHLTAANIKFRANHSWDYNYGSDLANGVLGAGAANIPVSLEADYAITMDLSHPNTYTYSLNRWGIIGDATADGWNSDQNMTWDATNKVFRATINLVVGAIKFRANDAWDVNYGGDLNALTPGGANIAIASAGSYTITFDPWALRATVTKN
jgi:starch-binding outer membrane protein SusE/F